MTAHGDAWPVELKVSADRRTLRAVFDDGRAYDLSAEMLRVRSPSAEVQGHSPAQRVTVGGKRDVTIANVLPIGNYAVKLVFSDGHDTGLFTWSYLSEAGENAEAIRAEYLAELAEKQMSRER